MDDRLINRDLGISFSAISVLDEDSLDYYGYHLIDGEYLKDQKNHNYINILMSQRIADALGYAVDSKIELEIKNDIYNFNVVGLYDNQEVSSLIHNPSITPFIDIVMTNDDMMNILNENQGEFKFENVAFRYKGIENMDKYEKYIIDIFKISQAKYYSDIEFEYDLNSNIKTIEQLVLPLNNATIIFNMMTILLVVVAFIILFASIGYIIKNRLKDLAIFIALGQTKLKTIVMVIVEMGLITFLAIILTIPTSLISYNKIKDIFIDINLKRQEDMALIKTDSKEYNAFVNEVEIYHDVDDIKINGLSFVILLGITYTIIISSCIVSLKEIIYLKPKELIYKRR